MVIKQLHHIKEQNTLAVCIKLINFQYWKKYIELQVIKPRIRETFLLITSTCSLNEIFVENITFKS